MKYYEKNMRLLKEKYSNLYKRIKSYENNKNFEMYDSPSESIISKIIDKKNNFIIYVEKTKNNDYTMKIEKGSQKMYFHSKYNPKKEAKKIVKNFGFNSKKQIFLLGIGLGYYLNEFNDEKKYKTIIIIEPFFSIFYAAICFNDFGEILVNKNVIFLIENKDLIFDVMRKYINLDLNHDVDFLDLKPEVKIFQDYFDNINNEIKKGIYFKMYSLSSDVMQARKWRNNIIYNLPYILNSPKIDDFFDEFSNIPAICVSAGPSLDKNINEIKTAKGKALIICVGTSLKPLLSVGVEPDIIVTMDGNYANYRHFKDLKINSNSFLFSAFANNHFINEKWSSKQAFFNLNRNGSGWIEEMKGEYYPVKAGGTVSHCMVDIAVKMDANPIILVGQDLSYKNNGATHASQSTYGNKKNTIKDLIKTEGIFGGEVDTSKSFLTMIKYFENYFSKLDNKFKIINATEGGARISNTEVMTLKAAIENYCQHNSLSVYKKLDSIFNNSFIEKNKNNIKNILIDTKVHLENSIKIVEEQMGLINKYLKKIKNEDEENKLNYYEEKMKKYEFKLKQNKYILYFLERTLLPEKMKLEESKNKYYINKKQSLLQRLKAYKKYREKFLEELKNSFDLINDLYFNEDQLISDNIFKDESEVLK